MGEQPPSHCKSRENPCIVFKSQDKEVYRIPALLYLREKKIFVAFAEKRDSTNDAHSVALVMKTGEVTWDETSHAVTDIKWSESTDVITKDELQDHRPMNPCPIYDTSSGTLFLFFITVEGTVSERWQIKNNNNKARLCYMTTTDVGQNWSGVTDLTDTLAEIKGWPTFAVGPGHGLQTEEGRLIVPVYAYNLLWSWPSPISCSLSWPFSWLCSCPWPILCWTSCSCCMWSRSAPYALSLYFGDDSGKSWKFGKRLEAVSLECQMAEIFDENNKSIIYCNARDQGGPRVEAVSQCKGEEFSLMDSKLVETGSGCQGSIVSFPAQSEGGKNDNLDLKPKWLLYTHPTDQSKRRDLGVYLNKSPQDPNAWSEPWVVNPGPSGYSDLAYLDQGWFACLYEGGEAKETEQISLVLFSYSMIKPNK